MSNFGDVFREERYYCNHFFRLLCQGLNLKSAGSGLRMVLKALQLNGLNDKNDFSTTEVYTEVAVFRDIFYKSDKKDTFLEKIFAIFLPIIAGQYGGQINSPTRPEAVRERIGIVHPSKYADEVTEPDFEKSDVLFYREFGALFNAKPDFLVLIPKHALWIEAKVIEADSAIAAKLKVIGL